MKKVLVISYYFPPAGGSAVQRTLKFVKYLPLYGWQPVVLTARGEDFVLRDDSLLSEVPDKIPVYRTQAPDFYSWFGRLGGKKKEGPVDLSAIAVGEGKTNSLLKRSALLARSALFIPDARVGWLPFALMKGKEILRKENIRAIFTSAPPFTTTLAGGLLYSASGIPWISDYRDPWTQAYFYFPRPGLSRQYEDFLEKRFLKLADRVVSINQRILDGLTRKYGVPVENRTAVIPNGYDPEDFESLKPVRSDGFAITYTGTQNAKMNASFFLRAVKHLGSVHPEFIRDIRILFIGRIGEDLLSFFKKEGLDSNIQYIPHLPHRECLGYTLGSDLLLLLIPDTPGNELIMTGKLFEYLRSGNPILCLCDRGEAADLIREAKAGFTVSPNDIGEIRRILWDAYCKWKEGKKILKGSDSKVVERYDRKRNTEKLADLLNEMTQ